MNVTVLKRAVKGQRKSPTERDARHICIIGMMAVGKTTVGRLLAQSLGRPFIDLDQEMVDSQQLSVSQMFATHGEPWFRELELKTLTEVLGRQVPHVISMGGGAVTTPACRQAMNAQAFVVWLRASPATVLARIGDASSRPLLAANPEEAVKRLDAERKDLYASVAHYAISVDRRSPRWVATTIARRLGNSRSQP